VQQGWRIPAFDVDSAFVQSFACSIPPLLLPQLGLINVFAIERKNNATFGSHVDSMRLFVPPVTLAMTIKKLTVLSFVQQLLAGFSLSRFSLKRKMMLFCPSQRTPLPKSAAISAPDFGRCAASLYNFPPAARP
jgi:hypothetical protein